MARHLVAEAVGARVNSDNTTAVIVALNSGIEELPLTAAPNTKLATPPSEDPFANFTESNF